MKYIMVALMITGSLSALAGAYEVTVKANSDKLSYLVTIINNSARDIWCKGRVTISADTVYVDGFADEVSPYSTFYNAYTSPAPVEITSIQHDIKCEDL